MKIDAVRKLVQGMAKDGIDKTDAQALVKKVAGKDGTLSQVEATQLKKVMSEFKDAFTAAGAREVKSALSTKLTGATGRSSGAYGRTAGGTAPARTGGSYGRTGGSPPARTGGTTPARTGGSYGRNVVDWSSPGRRTAGIYR